MPTRITHCPLDCPDTCSLSVGVEDGRVVGIGAAAGNDTTQGFICSKVAGFGGRQHHDLRIRHPTRREGGKGDGEYERISWDEALDEITNRFQRLIEGPGAEAILPFHYGGSNGLATDDLTDDLYFARLGASRLGKTICAVPTTEVAKGMYGKMPGVAFEDFVHARLIVIWGANPKRSNIHLVPYLKQARERGAKVVAIDPRRNFSHEEIDLHLPVLPGQDLPLALALIQHWRTTGAFDDDFITASVVDVQPLLEAAEAWTIERAAAVSGVDAEAIRKLADLYAATDPAVIRCGWGLERNRNGGAAVAAILAMPALLGKFGVRGGGYTMSNSGASSFEARSILGDLDWNTRQINMTRLAAELVERSDPRIEALFVYNANPAATVPNQVAVLEQLKREDLFTVVFDQVWTDTAAYADIVLPATTFLEHHDFQCGYGAYHWGEVEPVVAPEGEARSNQWVFGELARRMGFEDEAFGWDEAELVRRVRAVVAPTPAADAGEVNEDGGNGASKAWNLTFDGAGFEKGGPVQFGNSFPLTADGKVHLAPSVLGEDPFGWHRPDNHFPLALISPASNRRINSMMGELVDEPLAVTMHPDDAAVRDLTSGDAVEVFNRQAKVACRLKVSEAVRPGVVEIPKGAWCRDSDNGLTATALCPDHVQEVGGAACFNDARVDVRGR